MLRLTQLPRPQATSFEPLIDRTGDADLPPGVSPIQLLESCEVRYEWVGIPSELHQVTADPEELFQPDAADGRKGRLRPGLAVGSLNVVLRHGGQRFGDLDLEVRSRKLAYLSEYRWMLHDIASEMTEIVMHRFAASEATFAQDYSRDAVTLYQRFAFLRALFSSDSFQVALAEIARRPHVGWIQREEMVRPGEPLRANASVARQLSRPGPRDRWVGGPLASIPSRMHRQRTEATHDTTPNRFVRFALERWRSVIVDIDRVLALEPSLPAARRGRQEITETLEQLEQVLQRDLFRNLSPLARFPSDDQVLQRREGYREVFRAYLEFELAARLSWRKSDSDYRAGQQDIATLYEYWTFIQLAKVIAGLVGQDFNLAPLVEHGKDGLNVALQSGQETIVAGHAVRLGRALDIQLCFNRTFWKGRGLNSWTRPMRPDFSLVVLPGPGETAAFEPIVVHFDAKYRVSFVDEAFGKEDEVVTSSDTGGSVDGRAGALRSDLLKMHAYRDAIRRSAGAYVLYPGGDKQIGIKPFEEYHELLPGLGAFVLRPTDQGEAIGVGALRTFLNDILDHVAMRLTQHERGRYWLEEVYQATTAPRDPANLELLRPGPETTVLVGYVKSKAHWDWVLARKTYNVRTGGRPGSVSQDAEVLHSHFLLLYCPETGSVVLTRIVSDPELVTEAQMRAVKYPEPAGDYLCVQWRWTSQQPVQHLTAERLAGMVAGRGVRLGTPVMTKWFELANLDAGS